MKSLTDNQKRFTTFGVLGGILLAIGTKKSTSVTVVYAVAFGALGYYIGEKI